MQLIRDNCLFLKILLETMTRLFLRNQLITPQEQRNVKVLVEFGFFFLDEFDQIANSRCCVLHDFTRGVVQELCVGQNSIDIEEDLLFAQIEVLPQSSHYQVKVHLVRHHRVVLRRIDGRVGSEDFRGLFICIQELSDDPHIVFVVYSASQMEVTNLSDHEGEPNLLGLKDLLVQSEVREQVVKLELFFTQLGQIHFLPAELHLLDTLL